MTDIQPTDRLGDLAARLPAASRVFQRHALDFCCGGAQTLTRACEEAQLEPAALIREIEEESRGPEASEQGFLRRPLAEVIDHILVRYHEPLRPELDRLVAMASKVERVHGAKDPERLSRLAAVLSGLREELLVHMRKEEEILFPLIRAGRGREAGPPISVMEREHDEAARALREIAALTERFTAPKAACGTWRALYLGLEALDAELKAHVHLENHVLFPRALAE